MGHHSSNDSVRRPEGAPAYYGSSGPPVQSRSLPVGLSNAPQHEEQQILQNNHNKASVSDISTGADVTTGRTNMGLAKGGGGDEGAQPVSRERAVESIARAKPGNKRKLGGIAWGFGAATDSNNGRPKRQASPPPAAAAISRGSAGRTGQPTSSKSDVAGSHGDILRRTVDGSGRDAVGAPTVSRRSSDGKNAIVGKPGEASASSRTSFATALKHDQPAHCPPGSDVSTRRKRQSDGDGKHSPTVKGSDTINESRRHSFEGSRRGFGEAAGSVRAPVRSEDGRTAVLAPSESSEFEGGSSRWQQQEASGLRFPQRLPGSRAAAQLPAATQGNATGAPHSHLSQSGPSAPEISVADSPEGAVERAKGTVPAKRPPGTSGANPPGQYDDSFTAAAPRPAGGGATVSGASILPTKQNQQMHEGPSEQRKRAGSGAKARAGGSVLTSSVLEELSLDGAGGALAGGGASERDRCRGGVQQGREEDTAMAGRSGRNL